MTKGEFIKMYEHIPDDTPMFIQLEGSAYVPVCGHQNGLMQAVEYDGACNNFILVLPCVCRPVHVPVVPEINLS